MKRPQLLLSPISLGLLLFLFTGLGWTLWHSGGVAFSPGPVTAKTLPGVNLGGFESHASFEGECWRCHQPLKTDQASLCLECHTLIAEEIKQTSGLHAAVEDTRKCFICHNEHKGREFDPGLNALSHFDHTITQFDLIWHQVNYDATPIDCFSCHVSNQEGFVLRRESCLECHSLHDQSFMQVHEVEFGPACQKCHDGLDRMVDFDHTVTGFQLDGKHAQSTCSDCHGLGSHWQVDSRFTGDPFKDTPSECKACHNEPDVHLGMFGEACQLCHSTQAWLPAYIDGSAFNHSSHTRFNLVRHVYDDSGVMRTCTSCHKGLSSDPVIAQCINCHANQDTGFMVEHQELFGGDCLGCHDGVDRLSDFDHQAIFPIAGAHAEISCSDCHQDKTFTGTPGECVSCHAEPEIHVGIFGSQCQYCHTEEGWLPALLHIHTFPLDHGEGGESVCTVCHTQIYTEYTCYGCHEHQPDEILEKHNKEGIPTEDLADCVACHTDGLEDEVGEHGFEKPDS